jgi:hypothetical protein
VESLNSCFDELEDCIERKKGEVAKAAEQFYRGAVERLMEAERTAKEEMAKLEEMVRVVAGKAERLDATALCLFYYEKRDTLHAVLEEGGLLYDGLRGLTPELRWVVHADVLLPIKAELANLVVHTDNTHIEFTHCGTAQPKKGVLRRERDAVGPKEFRRAAFNMTGFWTPKHADSAK